MVATIVVPPTPVAVTSPLGATVATAGLPVVQATPGFATSAPVAVAALAASSARWPTVSASAAGETATDATGAGRTVTVPLARRAPLLAVMVAVPGATPVTTPVVET